MTEREEQQERYVTYALAMQMLGIGSSVMSRLLATGELPCTEHPFDKRKKLIKLSDISKLSLTGVPADTTTHHTAAEWTIYALVDPRDNKIRYVGRTIEAKRRLQQHLQEVAVNKKKSQWLRELKQLGIIPRMEILESMKCEAIDAERRETDWIRYLLDQGTPLTNIRGV